MQFLEMLAIFFAWPNLLVGLAVGVLCYLLLSRDDRRKRRR